MDDCDRIELDLPASLKYLNVVGACITEMLTRAEYLSEPDVTAYNLQLAVHEICTNLANHAYAGIQGGRIRLTLCLCTNPHRFTADLFDTGAAFDPSTVPAPDPEAGQVSGYGLFLARELMDEVRYERRTTGNFWHLRKTL